VVIRVYGGIVVNVNGCFIVGTQNILPSMKLISDHFYSSLFHEIIHGLNCPVTDRVA